MFYKTISKIQIMCVILPIDGSQCQYFGNDINITRSYRPLKCYWPRIYHWTNFFRLTLLTSLSLTLFDWIRNYIIVDVCFHYGTIKLTRSSSRKLQHLLN
jgi:hypothetical protein